MKSASAADADAATAPPLPPQPPSIHPDCRRYWALWTESYGELETGSDGIAPLPRDRWEARAPNVDRWSEELELARYNTRVRARIDGTRQRIDGHAPTSRRRRRTLRRWVKEMEALTLELDLATILPRVWGGDEGFWNESVPSSVKHDVEFARLLLKSKKALPLSFQKMLWMDLSCPLRKDRDILLESLGKGLDPDHVQIVWSQDLANDRALVLKCLTMCPECLSFGGDSGRR